MFSLVIKYSEDLLQDWLALGLDAWVRVRGAMEGHPHENGAAMSQSHKGLSYRQ